MIGALVLAAILGVLATYGLTGRGGQESGIANGFVAALPVVAVAGAGLAGITLPWAVGMAIAVALAVVLAPRVLASPRGPFAAAVLMTAGIVMAAAMLRWLVPIIADLTGLNARVLALACLAAATTVAAGNRATLVRTTFILGIIVTVLLLVGGVVAGAPATLTAPLVEVEQKPLPGVLWLIMVVIFGALHPKPAKSPAGGLIAALAMLVGLVGLLSVLAGFLAYPSNGLFAVAGYASSGGAVAGVVLAIIPLIVTVVATGAVMRASLAPWEGFTAPGKLASPAWQMVILAVLVALFTIALPPTWVMVTAVALAGIGAMIFDRRGGTKSEEVPAEAASAQA